MGTAHKVIWAILKVFEFCMSTVNLGILARFFQLVDEANVPKDPIWAYALAMAAISLCFSILLLPPVAYSFWCFPVDFIMFVMWIVSFALVENLTGVHTCNSHWYDEHWIIYWGDVAVLGGSACSRLRVIVAFSFIIAMFWFVSALLGVYTTVEYHGLGHKLSNLFKKLSCKKKHDDLEKNDTGQSETQRLHQNGPGTAPAAPETGNNDSRV